MEARAGPAARSAGPAVAPSKGATRTRYVGCVREVGEFSCDRYRGVDRPRQQREEEAMTKRYFVLFAAASLVAGAVGVQAQNQATDQTQQQQQQQQPPATVQQDQN